LEQTNKTKSNIIHSQPKKKKKSLTATRIKGIMNCYIKILLFRMKKIVDITQALKKDKTLPNIFPSKTSQNTSTLWWTSSFSPSTVEELKPENNSALT